MAKQNRQTISYLTQRFAEVGLNPNRRHGQNFLIDLNLIELLASSAQLCADDVVLEVGTGTASLTALLAPDAAHVVTVEIDGFLYQLAREELEEFDNVTMLKQDALKNKNHFAPEVLEAIQFQLDKIPGSVFKLAANLPYNIATPIISNLLRLEGRMIPASMTVTIQKELADRIMASPGSKDYGALSIWIQSLCDVELVRIMSPKVFWPRPKVDSAILHIVHRPDKRDQIPDVAFFHTFVRSMFFHRRKFLRSVAIAAFKNQLTKPEVDEVLTDMGLGPTARTEELVIGDIQKLSELFRKKVLAKENET